MRYILNTECIDTVLHFAAQSHVGKSSRGYQGWAWQGWDTRGELGKGGIPGVG